MKRYMISPIVGSGTSISPFRTAVADVSDVNTAALIPTHMSGPDIGKPVYGFAFCLVAFANITPVIQVTNSFVLPDYPLDARLDGMEAATRAAMKVNLEAYDLKGDNSYRFDASNSDSESYRDFLNRIMQQIEPAANVNALGVGEVAE